MAVTDNELLIFIKCHQNIKNKLTTFILAFIAIIGYALYNSYLRKTYGTIFLYFLIPVKSWAEAKEIAQVTFENWRYAYFSKWHYLFAGISVITGLFFIFKKNFKPNIVQHNIRIVLLFMFIGYGMFAALMLHLFPAHDYYFLDTFFLPLILLLSFIISFIPRIESQNKKIKIIALLVIGLTTFLLARKATKTQVERRNTGYWDTTNITINNFTGSDKFLDSLKISRNDKILVIGSFVPNIPFILMTEKVLRYQ